MGLGRLADFSVKEARERARKARQALHDGVDPIEARLAQRDAQPKDEAERITFKQAAERFLALHEAGWRNAKHRQQWRNTLQTYAYPTLGLRPVKAIDAALINQTLASIWLTIPETATRVKHRIERVLQWVKDGMPLPAPSASQRTTSHAALPYQEVPAFMAALRERKGVSALALQFLVATAARTGEVIGATWDEIDFKQKIWTVPGTRMKSNRPHRVPLAAPVLELLAKLPREDGSEFLFLGSQKGKPLSNMAMLELMRGIRPEYVPHGFRSSFKDWASETTAYPNIVSEAALAHKVADKTEAAYRRGDLLEKRRKLMQTWAAYCTTAPTARTGEVVPLRSA